ncbi:MAG: HAMP domain-containing histidine kinase [Oligoflexia bacterium]|nr:HAMP domain-containing histidine kinase [Oligoflexia bacterium]
MSQLDPEIGPGKSDMESGFSKFELPQSNARESATREPERGSSLPLSILVTNAEWLCRLRWLATATLFILGVVGLFDSFSGFSGLHFQAAPLLAVALTLLVLNLGYLEHLAVVTRTGNRRAARGHLRIQIFADLFLLTVVVHSLGSLETYAPFAYLFHVVLACVAFTKRSSFVIMLAAFACYAGLLALEATGVLGVENGIFANGTLRSCLGGRELFVNLASFLGISGTIWYLTSHLVSQIHARDLELAATNERLIGSQTEKTRHMLRTTHELKAPFAAIHANTQLLINGYCGPLSEDALAVIRRVAERARKLTVAIQSMLQLANLGSVPLDSVRWGLVDLAELLRRSAETVQPLAEERGIRIETSFYRAITHGVEDHLLMLFTNLISNAVLYSFKGGEVSVTNDLPANGAVTVIIQDHGIGIAPEKLPRIFDEYYRTEEAAAHNKDSSGLGLAIVKTVAQAHGIRITVESAPGAGTKFTCRVPVTQGTRGATPRGDGPRNFVSGLLRFMK